jgi:unsaturated rhamnogalacturonyl hydrolase
MQRAAAASISGDDARTASRRALEAGLQSTGRDGILSGVSAAVNACTNPSHYAHVPRGFVVPWGQGPLALALAERLHDEGVEAR